MIRFIRGKWMFINLSSGNEAYRFVVHYIDEKGEFKKAYSRSMFSEDIKEAIMRGGMG